MTCKTPVPGDLTMDSCMESAMEDQSNNHLNITRNPFDSHLYDKENFPAYSPSILIKSETPKSGQSGGFRWSIDQIATMQPTAMEEFPNQEYSVSYEKKEDEEREQRAIDEYFSQVALPSPWLQQKSSGDLKRVTFSPHPPSTRIIHEVNDSTTSIESVEQSGVTFLSDACCQTTLTIPIDFDFQKLIGEDMFTYHDETGEAKQLMISSLRRKLFDHEATPLCTKDRNRLPGKRSSKLTPSPSTPSYVTSSPCKDLQLKVPTPSSEHARTALEYMDESPPLSPLLDNSFVSLDSSPKQASNIGTPVHAQNATLSSVDVSPIQSCEKKSDFDWKPHSFSRFMPDVSFDDCEDSVDDLGLRASSRAQFNTPDVSPIKEDVVDRADSCEKSASLPIVTDSLNGNGRESRNVKESTAYNCHAFSDLEFSSIGPDHPTRDNDADNEVGPALDVTDLQKLHDGSDEDEDCGPLDISEFEPEFDKLLADQKKLPESKVMPAMTTPLKVMPAMTTPLKGILKKADLMNTPKSSRCVMEPISMRNSQQNHANLKTPQRCQDESFTHVCSPSNARKGKTESDIQVIFQEEDKENVPLHFLSPVQEDPVQWVWREHQFSYNENSIFYESSDPVSIQARSALLRADRLQSSLDSALASSHRGKKFRTEALLKNPLNSTELTLSPRESSYSAQQQLACSRKWDSASSMRKMVLTRPRSVSPLLPLDSLSIHSKINCSPIINRPSNSIPSRRTIYRSKSWPNSALMPPSSRVSLNRSSASMAVPLRRRPTSGLNSHVDNLKSMDWDSLGERDPVYASLLRSPLK